MGNCLITKLNASVNNENLPVLGGINIPVAAGSTLTIRTDNFINGSVNKVVLVSGNATITAGGESTSFPAEIIGNTGVNTNYVISAIEDSVVSLTSKYNIRSLVNDWDVDTQVFEYSPIVGFYMQEPTLMHGDIKYVLKLGNINTNIGIGNSSGGTFTGDLSVFGNCLSLTSFAIRYNNGITGSIESLVRKWVSNGRTSGNCTITCNGTTVTFNGAYTSAGNNKALSWSPNAQDGKTDITFAGTSITIDN